MVLRRDSIHAFLALLATCVLLGVLATPSRAAGLQYCVWNPATVATYPVPGTCQLNFEWSSAGVNEAIQRAGELDPGESEVLIGPGTIPVPYSTPIVVEPPSGEPVNVRGSGTGQTVLQQVAGLSEAFAAIEFRPTYLNPTSSISDLTVAVPASTSTLVGIRARGGNIRNVRFTVQGDTETAHHGLHTLGTSPTTVEDSQFEVNGINELTTGWYAENNSSVTRSTFTGSASAAADYQVGAYVVSTDGEGSPSAKLTRSSFSGFQRSIEQLGGEVRAQELLIETSGKDSSRGALIHAGNFRGDGLTIVGNAPNVAGVRAQGSVTADPDVEINNSIIQMEGMYAHDISCFSWVVGQANIEVRQTFHLKWIFDAALGVGGCSGTAAASYDRSVTPPVFDAGYKPAANSPVIDAGNSDSDRPPPKLDLAGKPRFFDGDNDGQAVIDAGAFEYQGPEPGPPGGGGSPTVPTVLTIQLGKAVGKFKIKKRKPKVFSLGSAKTKPRLPVTTNLDAELVLSLAKARAGYKSGAKCKAKKPSKGKAKRCDLPVKGSQTVPVKAGTSYLTFSGKWGRKKLSPGKYVLTVGARSIKDSKKSTLSVIR